MAVRCQLVRTCLSLVQSRCTTLHLAIGSLDRGTRTEFLVRVLGNSRIRTRDTSLKHLEENQIDVTRFTTHILTGVSLGPTV